MDGPYGYCYGAAWTWMSEGLGGGTNLMPPVASTVPPPTSRKSNRLGVHAASGRGVADYYGLALVGPQRVIYTGNNFESTIGPNKFGLSGKNAITHLLNYNLMSHTLPGCTRTKVKFFGVTAVNSVIRSTRTHDRLISQWSRRGNQAGIRGVWKGARRFCSRRNNQPGFCRPFVNKSKVVNPGSLP